MRSGVHISLTGSMQVTHRNDSDAWMAFNLQDPLRSTITEQQKLPPSLGCVRGSTGNTQPH
jgi:hypothetical protein